MTQKSKSQSNRNEANRNEMLALQGVNIETVVRE